MNFIPDDRAGGTQREFHNEVLRDDDVSDCFTNSPLNICQAYPSRDAQGRRNLTQWQGKWRHFRPYDRSSVPSRLFLRLVTGWQHHQLHKVLKLPKQLKYILFMYKRLLPLPGLTFLYPAGLVRD